MSGKTLNYNLGRNRNHVLEKRSCDQEKTYSDKLSEAIMLDTTSDPSRKRIDYTAIAMIHTGVMTRVPYSTALQDDEKSHRRQYHEL